MYLPGRDRREAGGEVDRFAGVDVACEQPGVAAMNERPGLGVERVPQLHSRRAARARRSTARPSGSWPGSSTVNPRRPARSAERSDEQFQFRPERAGAVVGPRPSGGSGPGVCGSPRSLSQFLVVVEELVEPAGAADARRARSAARAAARAAARLVVREQENRDGRWPVPVRSAPAAQWRRPGSRCGRRPRSAGRSRRDAGSRFAESVMSSWLMPVACVARASSRYQAMFGQQPRRLITVRIFFSAIVRCEFVAATVARSGRPARE